MATLTVRNVPEHAKHRFRQVAAAHGRSMEEHLRQLVVEAGTESEISPRGVSDVTQSFRPFPRVAPDPRAESRSRIERLMALGRGLDWEPEPREVEDFREHDWFK